MSDLVVNSSNKMADLVIIKLINKNILLLLIRFLLIRAANGIGTGSCLNIGAGDVLVEPTQLLLNMPPRVMLRLLHLPVIEVLNIDGNCVAHVRTAGGSLGVGSGEASLILALIGKLAASRHVIVLAICTTGMEKAVLVVASESLMV